VEAGICSVKELGVKEVFSFFYGAALSPNISSPILFSVYFPFKSHVYTAPMFFSAIKHETLVENI
jgi:hypothetical protein